MGGSQPIAPSGGMEDSKVSGMCRKSDIIECKNTMGCKWSNGRCTDGQSGMEDPQVSVMCRKSDMIECKNSMGCKWSNGRCTDGQDKMTGPQISSQLTARIRPQIFTNSNNGFNVNVPFASVSWQFKK